MGDQGADALSSETSGIPWPVIPSRVQPEDMFAVSASPGRWGDLSPLARAYGVIWDSLRADTDETLAMFSADLGLVEEAAEEFFAAFPTYVTDPPPHGEVGR